jgi:hypothetical protein
VIEWLADKVCNKMVFDKNICEKVIFVTCGPSEYFNSSRMAVYTTHTPAGASVKDMVHFAQMTLSGRFQMYDYGQEDNLKHYNQTTAPEYDINDVKIPVALYWGSEDWLSNPIDVQYLRFNLPFVVDDFELPTYNHLDFVWGLNSKDYLYPRVLQMMKNFK